MRYEKLLAKYRTRRQRALRLRLAGKTFKEIGDALGVSRARAEIIVYKARRDLTR